MLDPQDSPNAAKNRGASSEGGGNREHLSSAKAVAAPGPESAAATELPGDLEDHVEALIAACESSFGGPTMGNFEDDEDVMRPPSGITFGMIRRARAAWEALNG